MVPAPPPPSGSATPGEPVRLTAGHERGDAFTDSAPEGGLLVGLQIVKGKSWGGALCAVQPVYQVGTGYQLGQRHGARGGDEHQVIAKPGSVKPHKTFKGEIYVLSKDEGGRHTPFFSNYRPQFYFRTTDVTGSIKLPDGVEMVMPGDNVELEVDLLTPIALEKTMRFAIREGGRTVGAGRVGDILD